MSYSAKLHNKSPHEFCAHSDMWSNNVPRLCDRRQLTAGYRLRRLDFCHWVIAVISCEEAGQILSPPRLLSRRVTRAAKQYETIWSNAKHPTFSLTDNCSLPLYFFPLPQGETDSLQQNTLLNLLPSPRQRGTARWQTGCCISLI